MFHLLDKEIAFFIYLYYSIDLENPLFYLGFVFILMSFAVYFYTIDLANDIISNDGEKSVKKSVWNVVYKGIIPTLIIILIFESRVPIFTISMFFSGFYLARTRIYISYNETFKRVEGTRRKLSRFTIALIIVIVLLNLIEIMLNMTTFIPLIAFFAGSLLNIIIVTSISYLKNNDFWTWYTKYRLWKRMKTPVKAAFIGVIVIIGGLIIYDVNAIDDYRKEVYYIQMRDGTRLRTIVYFPSYSEDEPKPVILMRTPYNSESLEEDAKALLLVHDCIVVTQDLRGTPSATFAGNDTKSSEGQFDVFLSDWKDGPDTLEWILSQPWCNGKIGIIGFSAGGINQIVYLPEVGEKIGIAVLGVTTGDLYDYFFYTGGCPRLALPEGWIPDVTGLNAQFLLDEIENHPLKDDFYTNISITMNDRYKNIATRAIHLGGWYDLFCQSTIDTYMLFNQGTDNARDHQFLVMGPWNHSLSYSHWDVEYPEDPLYPGFDIFHDLELMLLSEYFSNKTIDWANYPHVFYYIMGDPEGKGSGKEYNVWRNASTWPIVNTTKDLYLYSDGSVSFNKISEDLLTFKPYKSYLYDPGNPVKTGGGTTLYTQYSGAVDQRRVEYTYPEDSYYGNNYFENGIPRSDIIKFTSDTLESPIEIVGRINARLYVSSNCTDTDFVVKLIDVYPDGREIWVAEGILKTRYRNGFNQSELMVPGNIYELNIDMWSTAYHFDTGHKIRISITSSDYDKFAINPNTGDDVKRIGPEDLEGSALIPVDYNIANNTVYCGYGGFYSTIQLPVVSDS